MLHKGTILDRVEGDPDPSTGIPGVVLDPREEQTICSFKPGSEQEVFLGTQTIAAEAELWLPLGTAITRLDGFRLEELYGEVLAEQPVYEVINTPEPGASGLYVLLRGLQPGGPDVI